jgi:hypothetical protein
MAVTKLYLELTALLIEREIAKLRRGEQIALVSAPVSRHHRILLRQRMQRRRPASR